LGRCQSCATEAKLGKEAITSIFKRNKHNKPNKPKQPWLTSLLYGNWRALCNHVADDGLWLYYRNPTKPSHSQVGYQSFVNASGVSLADLACFPGSKGKPDFLGARLDNGKTAARRAAAWSSELSVTT